jgi:hypothetical protein
LDEEREGVERCVDRGAGRDAKLALLMRDCEGGAGESGGRGAKGGLSE